MSATAHNSNTMELKTQWQKEKEARDFAIYNDYKTMSKDPSNAKTEINKLLMKRYGLHAMSSIYAAIKRVEKRLAKS